MPSVTQVPAGTSIQATQPGDFLLMNRKLLASRLISFGQRQRFIGNDRKYAHWSHAACVVDTDGTLVEAQTHGVVKTNVSDYTGVEYTYVSIIADGRDREQMARFALSAVGERYGFLTIFGLFLRLAVGSRINLSVDSRPVCSSLVARMLERGDYIFDRDTTAILPADLARYFHVPERVQLG